MEQVREKKRPLELDWGKLLSSDGDDDPPPLLVFTAAAKPPSAAEMDDDQSQSDELYGYGDKKLNDKIVDQRRHIAELGPRLPDRGAKLRARLKLLEEERDHRQRQRFRLQKDDDGYEASEQSKPGLSDGFKQEAPSSLPPSQSSFVSCFAKKLEQNSDCNTVGAFDKELYPLTPCDRRNMRHKAQVTPRAKLRNSSSSRQSAFRCPSSLSDKRTLPNGNQKGKNYSSPIRIGKRISGIFSNKANFFQVRHANDLRHKNGKIVVLVDEEEPQLVETVEQTNIADDCLKDSKIYYPSRDDPESVEICYPDLKCLAPETYLSSTVMNFYIRYLQQSSSLKDRARCDYHIFNTYFYEKLKEAVLNKPSDKGTLFIKFRRWWKGVNIFQKAYILLPIHENLHWSLVIICIPDEEDEWGPIILHLDSLELHFSKSIFNNVKSFLTEEWNHLNQLEDPPDLPIAERIWKNIPHRIDGKTIKVPQQKNDYDCGLFVLFFMERFIEDAPERLKRDDLAMFGKQWFRPEEASGLRKRIWKLLMEEFQNASKADCVLNPKPLSSVGSPVRRIENLVD